ncbi:MAG: hypothetical protein WC045_01870 [Patescibacteria group bacterium]
MSTAVVAANQRNTWGRVEETLQTNNAQSVEALKHKLVKLAAEKSALEKKFDEKNQQTGSMFFGFIVRPGLLPSSVMSLTREQNAEIKQIQEELTGLDLQITELKKDIEKLEFNPDHWREKLLAYGILPWAIVKQNFYEHLCKKHKMVTFRHLAMDGTTHCLPGHERPGSKEEGQADNMFNLTIFILLSAVATAGVFLLSSSPNPIASSLLWVALTAFATWAVCDSSKPGPREVLVTSSILLVINAFVSTAPALILSSGFLAAIGTTLGGFTALALVWFFGSIFIVIGLADNSQTLQTLTNHMARKLAFLHTRDKKSQAAFFFPNGRDDQYGYEIKVQFPEVPDQFVETLNQAIQTQFPRFVTAVPEAITIDKDDKVRVINRLFGDLLDAKKKETLARREAAKRHMVDLIADPIHGLELPDGYIAILFQHGVFASEQELMEEAKNYDNSED